jgi:hypothetical protein
MKKLIATMMLLMMVSVAFAGKTAEPDGAIGNPKTYELCHDSLGKWNPQSKSCDPNACGCLFHEIEDFFKGIFGF